MQFSLGLNHRQLETCICMSSDFHSCFPVIPYEKKSVFQKDSLAGPGSLLISRMAGGPLNVTISFPVGKRQ